MSHFLPSAGAAVLACCLPVLAGDDPAGSIVVSSYLDDELVAIDPTTGELQLTFGSDGPLSRPWGVAEGPDGLLYVCSFGNNRILRYDASTGAYVDTFLEGFPLAGPAAIQFTDDGFLYVSNFIGAQVVRYDASTGMFDAIVAQDPLLNTPVGFLATDGEILATNFVANTIVRFDATGDASVLVEDPTVRDPEGIALTPQGDLLVTTVGPSAILRFDFETGMALGEFASGDELLTPRPFVSAPMERCTPAATVWTRSCGYDGMTGDLLGTLGTDLFDGPTHLLFLDDAIGDPVVSCPGDADGDGLVGTADLLGMLIVWGTDDAAYDFDDDGLIGTADLLLLIANWGPCPAP